MPQKSDDVSIVASRGVSRGERLISLAGQQALEIHDFENRVALPDGDDAEPAAIGRRRESPDRVERGQAAAKVDDMARFAGQRPARVRFKPLVLDEQRTALRHARSQEAVDGGVLAGRSTGGEGREGENGKEQLALGGRVGRCALRFHEPHDSPVASETY
ncbi:MAG: hypothetical protein ACJ76J_30770 [Thermoanaerobaculia bacterium]